nr:putative retrotransposon protein [Tanacetum cinerariifolium]GFA89961.1 putative retrotransposon protein [Tanacetum cinerariifolium]
YLLKHKHEVFETFKVFQKEVETQLGKTIKSLRSDRAKKVEKTPYEVWHGKAPKLSYLKVWGCKALVKRDTLTKIPTKKVEKTSYEVWHGKAPKLSYLKVWGCKALIKRDTLTKPDKLEPRSIKCIFIGYPKETIGYSFYYPPENKVLVARNAEFLENSLINQEASGSIEDLEIIQEEDTHPSIDTSLNHEGDDLEIDEPQSDIVPIRRSIHMQEKLRLSKSQGASTPAELKHMQNVSYASAVGSIMYAVRYTRPDVTFAQNVTSQFQQNLGDLHWTTVKNILKYLRNTKDMFLVYGGDLKRELRVSCYTDAGYLTDADDLKSQTGYVFVLNGGAVD